MTAHEIYLTGVLESFSTFCENKGVASDEIREANLVLVSLIKDLGTKTGYLNDPATFLEKASKNPQASQSSIQLVIQFVTHYPPFQTAIFLRQFLLSLSESGCSYSTVKNYRSDINQFYIFAKENDLKKTLVKPKVAAFLRQEYQSGSSLATVKRKLSSITQFSIWLERVGFLSNHGSDEIQDLNRHPDSLVTGETPVSLDESRTAPQQIPKTRGLFSAAQLLPKGQSANKTQNSANGIKSVFSTNAQHQEYSHQLKSNLLELQRKLNTKTNQWLFTYLNIAFMILFFIGLSYFGYQQFYKETSSTLAFPSALTRPNRVLSFQGRLTDIAENPVTSATNFRFRLYDSGPSIVGGTTLWDSGTCSVTPDQDGIFNVGLGSDCGSEIGSSVFSENANVWLQVEVGAEVLSPRQSIKTVAYALNSETLQGYPASASATENTVLVMNNSGEVVLGNTTPVLKSTGTSFAIEARTLTLRTTAGSNGNIVLSPDGIGKVTSTKYFEAPGATLSATYAGGTSLVLRGGPSGTADIMQWQTNTGTALGVINSAGNIGIGTTTTRAALDVAGSASLSGELSFRGTTDPKINILNNENFGIRTSPGGNAGLTERFTVLSNGNIGISSTTPSTLFNIDDNASVGSGILVTGGGGGGPLATFTRDIGADTIVQIGGSGGDAQMLFQTTGNTFAIGTDGTSFNISDNTTLGTNDRFTIDSSGNVGIGSITPTAGHKLDVNGNIFASGGGVYTSNNFVFGSSTSTGEYLTVTGNDINILAGASSRLYIDGDGGNIGVGTTNPASFRLQVAGNVGPQTDSTHDLGSPALAWANIYGDTIYQNGNQVCDESGNCTSSGLWQNTNNAFHPRNAWASVADVLVGGNSTASADFRVTGLGNGGSDLSGYTYGRRFIDIDATTYYVEPGNTTTAANLDGDILLGSADQIDFADNSEDKVYWYSNTYGTGIESGTLTNWAQARHRWRIGGTSTSTGTQGMALTSTGLALGTGDPTARLDVTGDASVSGSLVMRGASPNTIDILNGNRFDIQNSPGGDAGLTARMTILSNGNVGIGSITPGAKLDVVGAGIMETLTLDGTSGTALNISSTGITTDINLQNSETIDNNTDGTINLGTTILSLTGTSTITASSLTTFTTNANLSMASTTGLTLGNNAVINLGAGTGGTINGSTAGDGDLTIQGTSNATRTTSYVNIQPNGGNVGVGLSSPTSFKLQVAGSVGPGTDSLYDLGSLALAWANIYGDTIYQGGNQVCDTSGNCTTSGLWQNTNNVFHPRDQWAQVADLVVGGTSTASADFQVIGSGANAGYVSGRRFIDIDAPTYYVEPGNTSIAGAFAGNVGIGTTNPGAALQIQLPATAVASATQYSIRSNPTLAGAINTAQTAFYGQETFPVLNLTGGSSNTLTNFYGELIDMTITNGTVTNYFGQYIANPSGGTITNKYALVTESSSGNVGFGTTNPDHLLEINGTANNAQNGLAFATSGTTSVEIFPGATDRLDLASGDSMNLVSGAYEVGGTDVITSARLVQGANGAVGAPSLSFSSDADTGFYTDGSNKLQITTGGTNRMVVDSAGNVGIGTTNPTSFKLQVAGNIGPQTDSTHNLGSLALAWANIYGDTIYQSGNQVCDTSGNCTNSGLWQNTNNVYHPRDQWAQVADIVVGGTSTASADFQVIGSGANAGYASGRRFIDIDAPTYYVEPGNTSIAGAFAGNVGIGTTNPSAALQIQLPSTAVASTTQYSIRSNPTLAGAINTAQTAFYGQETFPVLNLTGGSSNTLTNYYGELIDMTITNGTVTNYFGQYIANPSGGTITNKYALVTESSSGNVGFGTTNPDHLLEINGTAATAANGIGFATSGTISVEIFPGATDRLDLASGDSLNLVSGSYRVGNTDVITSARLVQGANGAVGAPSLTFSGDPDTGLYTDGSNKLQITTGGTNRMVVDSAGNVGIGTTNPTSFKLQVAGNIGPQTDSTHNLGSLALAWANIYGDTIYQNGNQVCDESGNCTSSGLWQNTNNAFHPRDQWASVADVLIGSTATNSAKFAFMNVASGTPTASISGNLALSSPTGAAPATTYDIFNNGTYNLRQSPGGNALLTSRLFISNNGNVGISSTTPGAKLDVAGTGIIDTLTLDGSSGTALNISSTGITTDINLQNSETIDNNTDGTINLGTTILSLTGTSTITASSLTTFTTNANLSMASTTGLTLGNNAVINLGAGTGGTINGSTAGDGDLTIQGTSNATRTTSYVNIQPNGGNVGIGGETAPVSKVEIRQSSTGTGYGGTNGAGALRISYSTGYGVGIDTWDGGTPRWGILSYSVDTPTVVMEGRHNSPDVVFNAGNVGIGTTGPTQALHVGGNLRVTGAFYDSSNSAGSNNYILISSGGGTQTTWTNPEDILDSGWWDNTNNVIHPRGAYAQIADLVIGGNSTASADFQVIGSGTNAGYVYGNKYFAQNGTSAAPAFSFTNDPNTGFYNVSADLVGFTANGSDRWMTGSSSLYGTSAGSALTGSFHINRDAGAVGTPTYSFGGDTNLGLYRFAADQINIVTAGADRMTVDAAGNVGIGLTTTAAKLDIDTGSNTTGLRLRGTAEATEISDIFVGAGGQLTLSQANTGAASGYVEIDAEDDQYGLILRDSSTGSTQYSNMYMNDAATDYLNIIVNNTNAAAGLIVQSGGNVGVGTTAPGGLFAVGATSNFQIASTGNINKIGNVAHAISDVSGNLTINANSTAHILMQTNGGNVGIGTTVAPGALLEVYGTGSPQLELSYNASNNTTFAISSAGDLTIVPSGGDANITGTLDVSSRAAVGANASVGSTTALRVEENFAVNGATYQIYSNPTITSPTLTADRTSYGTFIDIIDAKTEDTVGGFDSSNTAGYFRARTTTGASHTFSSVMAIEAYGANYSDSATNIGNIYGINAEAQQLSTVSTVPNAYTFLGNTRGSTAAVTTSAITNAMGGYFRIYPYNTGITNAYGVRSLVNTVDAYVGDIGTAYGFYGAVQNASDDGAAITTGYGSHLIVNRSGGTMPLFTTAYGYSVNVADATTAYGIDVVTTDTDNVNAYGMRINTSGATSNNYGIWGEAGDWVLDQDGTGVAGGTGSGGDLVLGEGQDLEIYHDGTNSFITNNTGYFAINGAAAANDVILQSVTGNVGIGTTSGITDRLDVNGTLRVRTLGAAQATNVCISGTGVISSCSGAFVDGAGTANYLARWTDTDTIGIGVTYDNGTNVGIGTTVPTAKLDIAGDASASGSLVLRGANPSTIDILNGNRLDLQTSPGGDAGLTSRVSLLNNGNVGIGTTAPTHKLEINGTAADAPNGIGFGTSGTVDTEIFRGAAGRVDFGASDYLNIPSALASTNNALNVTSTTTNISSGRMLNIQKTGASGGTAFTGDIARIAYSHTYNANTGISHTGNVLDISRALTLNTAGTHTVSGALVTIDDSMTQSAGTLTHTASVIDATQNYTSSTGTAFYFKNYGSNTSTSLRVDDASGDGSPFIIDATGNVGIGSTTVSTRLHLTGAPAGGSPYIGQVYIEPGANDDSGAISLKTTWTASDQVWTLLAGSGAPNANFRIYDSTAGADRLNIDTTGNVGIGTTTPIRKFHMNGNTSDVTLRVDTTNADPNITFTTLTQKDWSIGVDYSDSGKFKIDDTTTVGGSTRFTIDTAGNVALGTALPSRQLHIVGAGQTTAALTDAGNKGGTLYLQDSGSAAGNGGALLFGASQGHFAAIKGLIYDGSGTTKGHLAFSTRNSTADTALTERARIDTEGNFSVGNDLMINPNDSGSNPGMPWMRSNGNYLVINPNASNLYLSWDSGTGNTIYFQNSSNYITGGGNWAMSGDVSIGSTTARAKLDVNGGAAWTTSSWAKSIYMNNGSMIRWAHDGSVYSGFGHTASAWYWATSTADDASAVPTYPMYLTNSGALTTGSLYLASDTLTAAGFLDIRQSSGTYGLILRQTGDTSDWGNIEVNETTLGFGKNNDAGQMFLDDNGNVGIGTATPTTKLSVYGNINVQFGNTTTANRGFYYTDGANDLYLGGSNSQDGSLKFNNTGGTVKVHIGAENYTESTNELVNIGQDGTYGKIEANFSTNNNQGLCWVADGNLDLIVDCSSAPTDLAEYFGTSDASVEAGDLVSVTGQAYIVPDPHTPGVMTSKAFIKKTTSSYDPEMIGIISTHPNQVYGGDGVFADSENPRPVSMAGRVPTKVTASNGAIKTGDRLTASNIPGVAMKATEAGWVVGIALEDFSGPGIGKVITFVKPVWYDPNMKFTNTGDIVINGTEATGYTVTAVNNNSILTNIVSAGQFITAKLTAGLVTTKTLIVEQSATIASLSVTNMNIAGQNIQDYIASIVDTRLNQRSSVIFDNSASGSATLNNLVAETATISGSVTTASLETNTLTAGSTQLGSLIADTATVSTLLAQDASISGTLYADNITIENSARIAMLEAKTAELENIKAQTAEITTATISGTLYADNIYNFEEKIAQTLQQPSIMSIITGSYQPPAITDPNGVVQQLQEAGYNPSNPDFLTAAGADFTMDEDDVILGSAALFVEKYLDVNGLAYISETLGVGQAIMVGSGMTITDGAIAYAPAGITNPTLAIQPSGQGTLDLLAGLMRLENGKVTIDGNLYVAGTTTTDTLLTNLVQPKDFGSPFQVQVAGISTENSEVQKSRFEIINELGSPVATISAEGKASFAGGVTVGDVVLGPQTNQATPSAAPTSNQASGRGTITAGSSEVTIQTDKVLGTSLITVTPLGSTQNQVIFVKSQTADNPETPENEGRFVVGFDQAVNTDVQFNWLVVN